MGETVEARQLGPEIQVDNELKLRLLEPDDSQRIFEILQSGPEIQKYITWTVGLKSADEIRRAIDTFQQNGDVRYALLEDQEIVGYVGLAETKIGRAGDYEMGYFCDPSKRGQAFIPRAVDSLMTAAESILPVKTFALYIHDGNASSQAVAKKLGFRRTEEMKEDKILGLTERRY
jgi:RimJ/RimL family protein N-acetyltransferase